MSRRRVQLRVCDERHGCRRHPAGAEQQDYCKVPHAKSTAITSCDTIVGTVNVIAPPDCCTWGVAVPTRNCTLPARLPGGSCSFTCCGPIGIISRKLGRIIIGLV